MPPLYKLKHAHWVSLLWLIALALPCRLQAQQPGKSEAQQLQARKLAPHLQHVTRVALEAAYRVQVRDKQAFYTWLKQQKLQVKVKVTPHDRNTLLLSGINATQLQLLLSSPAVLYIDKPNRRAIEELELKDADFVANNIYAAQAAFLGLAGQGMGVSVKENAFNATDIDLLGRVLSPESIGDNRSQHATTMATLIAGAGNSGPNGKGVTQHTLIAHSSFEELYPDNSQNLLSQGISVQNHSYGVGVENYYGLEAQAYDRQSHQHPEMLHVFSSGNSGDKAETTGAYANLLGIANLTGQFKTSKNSISVGALEPSGEVGIRSSRGPAYDGRIKPELVAHGTGGTSEAAAVVSGIALLVQQAYKESYDKLPPASLVKAAMINSAEDVGRPGPDFESGYGSTDALGAISTIENQRFVLSSLLQGETQTIQLSVPTGTHLLKATLVWHDLEAEPNAEKALLNDLDLKLQRNASAQSWLPWVLSTYPHADSLRLPARRGTDRLNNIEQITVAQPSAGSYTLTVSGHRVQQGPQAFSLVYELERGMQWLYPTAGATLLSGQPALLSWQGILPNGTGRLEYRLAGSEGWQTISENLTLREQRYTWAIPDTVAVAQLRLSSGTTEIVSEEFMLSCPISPQVGFNCDNQVMLHWPSLPNVQQFQLYRLGETHLEPLLTTMDTLALLDKSMLQGGYIALAPVLQGRQAQYGRSIQLQEGGLGCYVTSFLPRQFVMDTVRLDLEISTLYQLASLSLERLESGGFKTVNTLFPVTQRQLTFSDSRPQPGRNIYRVKVETTTGKTFYSQQEDVIYASQDFMQVYPSPVAAGQPFFVAINGDAAHIQLYDQVGRLKLETSVTGVLKEVQTKGLTKGLYIIRAKTETGYLLSGKVLLL
ncbi:S8 family serine peptidase [uncultured Pontibacter sp.]|uniref:S8 family serine peptidase n=1 Tax=uncultured Pontibacter sp. TaxID=453356 RepID=UPI00262A1F03|nr:S8 family serine peptidase [uncultured Pontibacter sp.]